MNGDAVKDGAVTNGFSVEPAATETNGRYFALAA